MECGLGVPRGLEDHLMAHIKYTDGFPDQQTINLTYWKPGCAKSLTNEQFPPLGGNCWSGCKSTCPPLKLKLHHLERGCQPRSACVRSTQG